MTLPQVKRTNFVVSNLDIALQFYRDALGFEVDYTKAAPPGFIVFEAFSIPDDCEVQLCALSTPDQALVFELTEVRGVDLSQEMIPRRAAALIQVESLKSTRDKVLSLEGCSTSSIADVKGPDGKKRGIQCSLSDTDGNLVVIYELD